MRPIIPLATAAALLLAAPAVAPAAPKPACKKGQVCLPAGLKLTALEVEGKTTVKVVEEEPGYDFTFAGTSSVRSGAGTRAGAFVREDPLFSLAKLSGVRVTTAGTATYTDPDAGTYDCSVVTNPAAQPTAITAIALPAPGGRSGVSIRWTFPVPGWGASCTQPDGGSLPAPTPPEAPSDLAVTPVDAARLAKLGAGGRLRVPIELTRTWDDGTLEATQTWKGWAELRRG